MAVMLTIDIVSDVVCPWCFIGKRRLEQAMVLVRARRPDFVASVRWHPYFLNPDTPGAGEPYRPFLERKFGGPAAVDALLDRVRQAGRGAGVEFAFERIAVRAHTLDAHRLIHRAQARGDAGPLVERLFAGHFQLGEHVGDPDTLARIAAECGSAEAEVRRYLSSDEDRDAVRAEVEAARQGGVTAVPTFTFAGRERLVGSEAPEVLAEIMLRLC